MTQRVEQILTIKKEEAQTIYPNITGDLLIGVNRDFTHWDANFGLHASKCIKYGNTLHCSIFISDIVTCQPEMWETVRQWIVQNKSRFFSETIQTMFKNNRWDNLEL